MNQEAEESLSYAVYHKMFNDAYVSVFCKDSNTLNPSQFRELAHAIRLGETALEHLAFLRETDIKNPKLTAENEFLELKVKELKYILYDPEREIVSG